MVGAPAYGPPGAPTAMPYQPPKSGGGGKAVLLILVGLLVVGVIVVLLLGFAVGPKWFVSDSGSGGPEKVMDSFFQDMASGNAKGLVALIEPAAARELLTQIEDYGYDTLEEFFTELFLESFPEDDLKITGLKYKTTINGNNATVDVIAGKATYTDAYGDKVTETVDGGDNVFSDITYNLKKVGDKWYLMPEM